MYELALAIIGIVIAYEAYVLLIKQRELKNEMKRMKNDFNLEFKGPGGSVSKQRKNYPDQEHQANDDFRYTIGKEPHSISNGMNDSCREHKADYPEGK